MRAYLNVTVHGVTLVTLALLPQAVQGQPIPVELTAASRYATINLVLSKGFSQTSMFGFFHQSTMTVDYSEEEENDLALQQLVFFEPLHGFRLTAGGFYGGPGFSPTAGMQYLNAGRALFLLISPRVNIESDPSFSVFSIVRYKPDLAHNAKLYLSAQLLNTFDTDHHIKSYQWLRVGVDLQGTQFGLAVNFDEFGPHPDLAVSAGLFIRREIP